MFNVGGPEILVILLVALIVLGPEQLPKAMRTFGNVMGEIRKVSSGFQAEMRSAMDTIDTTAKTSDSSGGNATTPEAADVTETIGHDAPPAAGPVAEPAPNSTTSRADRAAG